MPLRKYMLEKQCSALESAVKLLGCSLSQSPCLSKQVFYLENPCLCSWRPRGMLNIKWKVKYKDTAEVLTDKISRHTQDFAAYRLNHLISQEYVLCLELISEAVCSKEEKGS